MPFLTTLVALDVTLVLVLTTVLEFTLVAELTLAGLLIVETNALVCVVNCPILVVLFLNF